MIEPVLKSKFLGALVGTGIGDALGAPFEGFYEVQTEEIEAMAERQEVLTYTDDTHMMIGVAESLIASKGFNGELLSSTNFASIIAELLGYFRFNGASACDDLVMFNHV